MSLAGKLDELGLGEILQIVSLSRKTGVLSLKSKGRDGSVFFRHGQVVRATSSIYKQSLGEVLIQKGVIDLAVLRKALSYQHENGFRELLGVILVKNFGVSQEIIDEVIRDQIENVVFSLFGWVEGTFSFEVQTSVNTIDGSKMDPLQFMLDQGLNPQFLAMEGARIQDEKRHADSSGFAVADPPDDFNFNLAGDTDTPPLPKPLTQQSVVIVDDDGPTLQAIAEGLANNGFVVHAMTRSEDTLIKVDSLHKRGEHPAVLIDLIMPKMDGSGVLGGFELLELLHNNFKDLQLIIMTDYHHADVEKKIRDLGYPFVIKPRRVEINNTEITNSFITQINHDIRHYSGAKGPGDVANLFNLGDELRTEMGEDADMPRVTEPAQQHAGFSLLRGMLEELNNPDLQGGVLLLILRFASEFVNRAVIFTISDHVISGFGQFGITGGAVSGDERVRSIHFPEESGSMFDEPLRTGQAITFLPDFTPVDSHVLNQLGGGLPTEVFIGPIISQSKVIGFLYGDNLPGTRPIGDVEALTIFLAQSGVSMEISLLERRLNERGAL